MEVVSTRVVFKTMNMDATRQEVTAVRKEMGCIDQAWGPPDPRLGNEETEKETCLKSQENHDMWCEGSVTRRRELSSVRLMTGQGLRSDHWTWQREVTGDSEEGCLITFGDKCLIRFRTRREKERGREDNMHPICKEFCCQTE